LLIKSFRIDKSKRLWIIILFALIIAIALILIAFIRIYSKNEKIMENNIYDIKGYEAEYTITIVSNKTKNTYDMYEYFSENNEKDYFKFEFTNDANEKYTYIFKDKSITISSNKQINILNIKDYDFFKENLISLSTFFKIYKDIELKKDNNYKLEKNKVDNTTILSISPLNKEGEMFRKELNISKLELIIDMNNKPIEYYVLDKYNNVIIGIKFNKFDVLEKFDEKIFANFNK